MHPKGIDELWHQGRARASSGETKSPPEHTGGEVVVEAREDVGVWMRDFGQQILRTTFLLLRDKQLAEDVSQETFLQAYRKRAQLRDPAKARSWLTQIAVNLCRQEMRRPGVRKTVVRDIAEDELLSTERPEDALMKHTLLWCVHELPYAYREVIVLYYYQEFSIADIANQLNVRQGTIKSRLSRGRKLLQSILAREGWQDERL